MLGARLLQHAVDNGASWLQGTDSAVEGEWRWSNGDLFWTGLADGSAPAGVFTAWGDMEPNQFMGNEEDCLQQFSNGWNDARCGQISTYLCQRPTP